MLLAALAAGLLDADAGEDGPGRRRAAPGGEVWDLGAGTGAAGLAHAAMLRAIGGGDAPAGPRGGAPGPLVLVERDPLAAALARENLARSGVAGRVLEADLLVEAGLAARGALPAGAAALVLTNPPFDDASRGRPSPDAARAAAHAMPAGALPAWLGAARRLLRPGGRLALIHRADALDLVLAAIARRFGAARLTFVHPRAGAPASRVLVSARAGSRAPLAVGPPLVVHAADGAFTPPAAALHRGERPEGR